MKIDFKEIIPKQTLPRFNCQKRIWIKPAELSVIESKHHYTVSYKIKMRKNVFRMYKVNLPKETFIDNKFLVALGLYACEGRNPNKGVYTDSSANKGRCVSIVNSDFRIIRLVLDEFESKLGIDRNKWILRLTLFDQHDVEKEKLWWSNILNMKIERIFITDVLTGNVKKANYAPHGRCNAELSSIIHAAIIYNLCEKLLNNKLYV